MSEAAVFGVKEAAEYLRLGVNEVRRLLRLGQLEGFRHDRHWRVSRAACDRWIAKQEEAARGQRAGLRVV